MHTPLNHFTLENFEGPLDFLLCLIQKDEIDIYEVPLQNLIQQFIHKLSEWQERQLELGAEFIGVMAYLVLLKSRMLVPQTNLEPLEEIVEEDPKFEIIHHLIDYCRFKQAAKDLNERFDKQTSYFYRGAPSSPAYQKPLGIDHVSMDELSELFKDLLKRASLPKKQIYEENWRVADKMNVIKLLIRENAQFSFEMLFLESQSRVEMIVIFLAVLELMKLGSIMVFRQAENMYIKEKVEE